MGRYRILTSCVRRRYWKGVRFILKSVILGTLWPFCVTCGRLKLSTRRCCWECQYNNILKFLETEAPDAQ
jgi:uncharacterized OB-fold protein